jgi:phytoene dehydrogenase-like protein
MPERKDVILGGGLAGLSAAYTLQNAGQREWQIYERNATPGGLARTMEVDGYRFDYGPHILFTIDDEIRELIQDLLSLCIQVFLPCKNIFCLGLFFVSVLLFPICTDFRHR